MRVKWTVKQNASGRYDIFKDDEAVQTNVPFETLESAMDPHHVRGQDWHDLLRQLMTTRQGEVVIDPWPPGKFFA